MSNLNRQAGVKFTNISDKVFIGCWEKTEYEINAGDTIMCPLYLAKHFAKHLVNQMSDAPISMVEDENGVPKDKKRRELYQKMISAPLFDGINEAEFQTKMMNEANKQNNVVRIHNSETNENVATDNSKATGYADEAKVEPVRTEENAPFVEKTKDDEFEGLEDEPKEESKPKKDEVAKSKTTK